MFNAELLDLNVKQDKEECSECFRCLWPFFSFSRSIGLSPISRSGNRLMALNNIWSFCWIPTLIALSLQLIMFSKVVKYFIEHISHGNFEMLVDDGNALTFYMQNISFFLFMIWKAKEIAGFLAACEKVEIICKKYQKTNDGLVRDSLLLFGFFVATQAFGNMLYYYTIASRNKNVTTFEDFIAEYETDLLGNWGKYSGIFFCLGTTYCDMSWNFGDTAIGLLSLILSRYFIRINRVLGDQRSNFSLIRIEELRHAHQEICNLVQHCNEIFSLLFLLTYAGNIGFLMTRLYVSIQADLVSETLSVSIEGIYASFQQIVIKIFLPSYLAAKLNEQAHAGLELVHDWPSSLDGPNAKHRLIVMERFVTQFEIPVGLSGSGYFLISKSFVVTLVSTLITYEVIIQQFQAAGNSR